MSLANMLEIASTQNNLDVVIEALLGELSSFELVPHFEKVNDNSLKISIDDSYGSEVATLINQYTEISNSFTVYEGACGSCAYLLLNETDELIDTLEKAGALNLEIARPLDVDDEDEEYYEPEDDLDIDGDEDDSDPDDEDDDDEQRMKILGTEEGFKLAQRLHSMSCGEKKHDMPKFLMELDHMLRNYRESSGYEPDDDDMEDLSSIFDIYEAALDVASADNALLEEARRKKKGKKGEWRTGRGGFLSAYMKIVAKRGDALAKAWDALDLDEMARLLTDLGGLLLDKIKDERIKRGIDEKEPEENTDDTTHTPETAGATYYILAQFDEESKKWEPQFSDRDKQVVKDELQDYKDQGIRAKHLKIIPVENGLYNKNVVKALEKLNAETAHVEIASVEDSFIIRK